MMVALILIVYLAVSMEHYREVSDWMDRFFR